ncbi:MAG: acetyl-CoA carboxylase biotin carboxyl carrier protein [bacterium]
MDLDLVKKLIEMVENSDISGLKVEEEGIKVDIKKEKMIAAQVVSQMPQPIAGSPTPAEIIPSEKIDTGLYPITSPMVGTFYLAPSPDAPSFVELGTAIEVGKVICIVEAMKLFNEIEAEVSGTVEKILVENAQPVEYGQTLMLIRKR